MGDAITYTQHSTIRACLSREIPDANNSTLFFVVFDYQFETMPFLECPRASLMNLKISWTLPSIDIFQLLSLEP